MTRWPAHLESRARIFELTGRDPTPLEGPTRVPLVIEDNQFIEFDPRNLRVLSVGRVGVEPQQQSDHQS